MKNENASQVWSRLDGDRASFMTRAERFAALTIPKLCLPPGVNAANTPQTHDYQSIGAQAVNHVVNKLMLALFAPSRPFFRSKIGKKLLETLQANGVNVEEEVTPALAQSERDAAAELDERALRPRLYTVLRHLVALGNVLMILEKDTIRTMGLRYWCVKRNVDGSMNTLVIRERVKFDELDLKVQAAVTGYTEESEVDYFRLLVSDGTTVTMTQWVNTVKLPGEFDGKWPKEDCPYHPLTWDLADEDNYGTGLVEEYSGDLEALSTLSEAVVDGGVLGTEFRWLVNPTGMTNVSDLNQSKNGDALAGKPEDIAPTQGGSPEAIKVASEVSDKYERRVSRGFLLNSAVTRDAERVTAEEIRLTAQELETSFGGVYSNLAVAIQKPIAYWLMKLAGTSLPKNVDIKLTIVTGLDALSRNGDLENLKLALMDLASLAALPPELQGRIKMDAIAAYVGTGRGVDLKPFIKSDAEYQKYLADAAKMRVTENTANAQGEAQAQASAA